MHISRIPLKERIAHAIYRLDTQMTKLQQTSTKLQQRDKEMLERCIGAKLSKDDAHAVIYANECVEIRKIAKIVMASELALERVMLRLQTVEEVGDLLVQMSPVLGVVKETKGKLAGIVPEVSRELGDINQMLNDTLLETGEATSRDMAVEAASEEARKVLDEASSIAEEKMDERFPELPEQLLATEKPAETPIALTEGIDTEPAATQQKNNETKIEDRTLTETRSVEPPVIASSPVQLENQIYDYIKGCAGDISINKCALDLGISKEDVKKAIDKLCEEGKVIVQ
jgi:division protein CdvB (Snf7/Vps24/ESCRT-III family)